MGIVGLPVAVVSTTKEGRTNRISGAHGEPARSPVEISRVLVKHRGQYGASDEPACCIVCVLCAEASCVALQPLMVPRKDVELLFNACIHACPNKGDRISCRTIGQRKLLSWPQRR